MKVERGLNGRGEGHPPESTVSLKPTALPVSLWMKLVIKAKRKSVKSHQG